MSVIFPFPEEFKIRIPITWLAGAIPLYKPLEEEPSPAAIPATCVPWPFSSRGRVLFGSVAS